VRIIEKYQKGVHRSDLADRHGAYRREEASSMRTIAAVLTCVAAFAAATGAQSTRTPVGPKELGWAVDLPTLAGNVSFEPTLGRADAIRLRSNTHVVKTGLDFGDGTIEFDLAPLANGHFTGITFRRQSFTNHENIYVRFHRSGDFMALQYAPRVNGSSTWQLYQEFAVATDWPRETWTRVRLELKGSKMDVFTGGATTPTLSVPRLRNGTTGGEIGFWARVNDRPQEWAAAISNLQIRPASSRVTLVPPANAPVEFVWNWQVSDPAPAEGMVRSLPPAIAKWSAARVEESGLVNVNRLFPVQKGRSVVFAKHTIRSDAARRVLAGIGYSDDVTVFVNGEPIYAGINGWDSRTPALNSFVDARWESAFLPFRAGDNEIVLAVADDQRFGWGFALRIDDSTGLKF
jgi:hypothetical protein